MYVNVGGSWVKDSERIPEFEFSIIRIVCTVEKFFVCKVML